MLHLQFTPFPFFETDRMYLRPVAISDAPEILILRSDPVVNKYIQRERATNIKDAEDFIKKISDQ